MLPFLKKHWSILLILLTSILICTANYKPGTILSGWDTLHPEFNFGLNLQRIFYGVFRSEQGLGAVAGHSHMGDLPRIILLMISDIFLPTQFLRYFYIFLTLIAGSLGMYFFLKRIVFKGKNETASFLGAMFYMLNLGTLQQFVVAFEMFNTLYATLPFLMLFATEYLLTNNDKKKPNKALLLFSGATFLSTPMSYAATLWYSYFLLLCVYLVFFALPALVKRQYAIVRKSAILVLVSLTINSFWLLPNLYFVINHATDVQNSYINILFSAQAFLYNKQFGTPKDLLLLKSFLFDWSAYTDYNSYVELLQPWIYHLEKLPVLIIGYKFGAIALLGFFYGAIKKQKAALSLIPVALVALFFLINENLPTSFLFTLLRDNFSVVREAMRFPHSKFYIHFMFLFAVYFAIGQGVIIDYFASIHKTEAKKITKLYPVFVTVLLVYFMLPAFQGQFISPLLRIKIPSEYSDMSAWFNQQKDARRIATLPINSFWGWDYYNWYGNKEPSFQGAGFLWFDIKQPFLVRDFDRWSTYNEDYYKEMSYAVYSQNPVLFKNVIEKYNIGYVLLDKSNIAPVADPTVLFYKNIDSLLMNKKSLEIESVKSFGKYITVFHFKQKRDYIYQITNPTTVTSNAKIDIEDLAYQKYGEYINTPKTPIKGSIVSYFPFKNIINNQNRLQIPYTVESDGVHLKLPNQYKESNFQADSYVNSEELIPANLIVKKQGSQLLINLYPFTPAENTSSNPIETKINLPDSNANYILSINQTNISSLTALSENTSYSLGRVYLSTKSANSVGIYKNKSTVFLNPDFPKLQFSLRSCNKIDSNQLFGIDFLDMEKGFSLHGRDVPLCMTIPFSELLANQDITDETLLGVSFNFQNSNTSKNISSLPNICITDIKTGGCLNYIAKSLSTKVSFTNNYISYYGVRSDTYKNLGIKIFFDATQLEKDQKISYTNFDFSLTDPVSYTEFTPDVIAKSLKPVLQNEFKGRDIIVPFSNNSDLNQDLTTLPKTTGLCENNPLIESKNKNKQTIQARENFVRYSADEGTMCDHLSYQNLTQAQGYILLVNARNLSGLPLNICVTNYLSKRCDLYAPLSISKEFKTDAFILPPISDTAFGYDININNFGIKNTPAINDLKSIQLIPFPYKWLTSLETRSDPNAPVVKSTTEKLNYKNINPISYLVDTNSLKKDSVISLSQSFERGWRAYEIQTPKLDPNLIGVKTQNFLKRTFPYVFGKEIKNHVIVNGWANGWVLNSNEQRTMNKEQGSKNQQLVIIFLPQYLEYMGFGLLIVAFAGIIISYKKNK